MFHHSDTRRQLDTIFLLAILTMFASTALLLVIFGVRQYRHCVDSMEHNYEVRTTSSYLIEKMRSVDPGSDIRILRQDDTTALALSQMVGDTEYITYIYYYDGWLRELLLSRDTPFTPAAGQRITEITGLSMDYDDFLIRLTYTDTRHNSHECDIHRR